MASMGQMTGMILAIAVPLMIGIVLFLQIKRALKVKGLFFTAAYGAAGYLWQAFIYVMIFGWISGVTSQSAFFEGGFGEFVRQIIIAVAYSMMTTFGLYWSMYLSNMRETRLERGTTVGLGFGIAYVIWNYVLIYGAPLVYSFQLRFGGFTGSEETKQRVMGLAVENMYLFILDMVIFLLILTATTIVMSHYQMQGCRMREFLVAFVSQFIMKLLNAVFPMLMPDVVSSVIYHILIGAVAVWSLWIILTYLRTKKVMMTPSKEWPDKISPSKGSTR